MHLIHKYEYYMGEVRGCKCGKLRVRPFNFYVGCDIAHAEEMLDYYRKVVAESNKALKKTGKPTWVLTHEANRHSFGPLT